MLIDTHCHLTHDRFGDDVDGTLARALEAGVERVVVIASTAEDAGDVLELVRNRESLWGTAGIHPHRSGEAEDGDLERVRELLEDPRMVAVGETGLDFHYDFSPRDVQRRLFEAHLQLAADTGLPVVVHSRSADDDTRALIRDCPRGLRGVLHCFTGGRDLQETALEAGWSISFTGLVTFRNFDAREAVRRVPRERLMVETDAPYLAPAPHRGKRNEPAYVRHVADAVARIRDEAPEDVASYTTENAEAFFALDPAP